MDSPETREERWKILRIALGVMLGLVFFDFLKTILDIVKSLLALV